MNNIIKVFNKYEEEIKRYIFDAITKLDREDINDSNIKEFFPIFKSLKSVYVVDKDFKQITPIFSKHSEDNEHLNEIDTTLKEHLLLDKNGEYISESYLSSKDGKPTVSISKQINDDEIITMKFNLYKLLDELNYLGNVDFFAKSTKFIYGLIGYALALFALILIFYSLYNFANELVTQHSDIVQAIFKSTIALTLGLAIFDLSKNLLEHEVFYKEYLVDSHGSKELLEKFLISIIIALAIEALMMVFKIALSDYKNMIYALYLIGAICGMIIALGFFNRSCKSKDTL
jgi:hypothetical protein